MPSKATRETVSVPSGAIPRLERASAGAESSRPSRISTPDGFPGLAAKKSPLTPTVVAAAFSACSISVSFSVATIALFERTGCNV